MKEILVEALFWVTLGPLWAALALVVVSGAIRR